MIRNLVKISKDFKKRYRVLRKEIIISHDFLKKDFDDSRTSILESELSTKPRKIILVGRSRSGKSTFGSFISAAQCGLGTLKMFPGADTGGTLTTSIWRLRYGKKNQMWIRKEDGLLLKPRPIKLDSEENIENVMDMLLNTAKSILHEHGIHGKYISKVTIELNNEGLKDFEFIDTPGFEDKCFFTEKVKNMCEETDIILYVSKVNEVDGLSEDNRKNIFDLIKRIGVNKSLSGKLVFVLTFLDEVYKTGKGTVMQDEVDKQRKKQQLIGDHYEEEDDMDSPNSPTVPSNEEITIKNAPIRKLSKEEMEKKKEEVKLKFYKVLHESIDLLHEYDFEELKNSIPVIVVNAGALPEKLDPNVRSWYVNHYEKERIFLMRHFKRILLQRPVKNILFNAYKKINKFYVFYTGDQNSIARLRKDNVKDIDEALKYLNAVTINRPIEAGVVEEEEEEEGEEVDEFLDLGIDLRSFITKEQAERFCLGRYREKISKGDKEMSERIEKFVRLKIRQSYNRVLENSEALGSLFQSLGLNVEIGVLCYNRHSTKASHFWNFAFGMCTCSIIVGFSCWLLGRDSKESSANHTEPELQNVEIVNQEGSKNKIVWGLGWFSTISTGIDIAKKALKEFWKRKKKQLEDEAVKKNMLDIAYYATISGAAGLAVVGLFWLLFNRTPNQSKDMKEYSSLESHPDYELFLSHWQALELTKAEFVSKTKEDFLDQAKATLRRKRESLMNQRPSERHKDVKLIRKIMLIEIDLLCLESEILCKGLRFKNNDESIKTAQSVIECGKIFGGVEVVRKTYNNVSKDYNNDGKILVLEKQLREIRIMNMARVKEMKRLLPLLCCYKNDDNILKIIAPYVSRDMWKGYIVEEKDNQKGQRRKLSEKEKLSIILRLAKAVEELHKIGVIHRDIKPNNMLVTEDLKDVFLIDFGHSVEEPHAKIDSQVGQEMFLDFITHCEMKDNEKYYGNRGNFLGITKKKRKKKKKKSKREEIEEYGKDRIENPLGMYGLEFDLFPFGVTIAMIYTRRIDVFEESYERAKRTGGVRDVKKMRDRKENVVTIRCRDDSPEFEKKLQKLISKCTSLNRKDRPRIEDVVSELEDIYSLIGNLRPHGIYVGDNQGSELVSLRNLQLDKTTPHRRIKRRKKKKENSHKLEKTTHIRRRIKRRKKKKEQPIHFGSSGKRKTKKVKKKKSRRRVKKKE